MQFMLGFCDSRADPDPSLQIIGMQFIRYNLLFVSYAAFDNNENAVPLWNL